MGLNDYKETSYEIGKLNYNMPGNFEPLGTENYTICKPTILCLGGNFTFTPNHAKGMCTIAADLLGIKEKSIDGQIATFDDVDVVGVSYGRCRYSENTSLSDSEINKLCNNTLLPMVTDRKGGRLPKEVAMKNASMLTLFTHCFGARMADELMLELSSRMSEVGYDLQEITDILSQITAVSYAPESDIHCGSHVKIRSFQDNIIPEWAISGPKGLRGIAITEGQLGKDCTVWSSRMANGVKEDVGEHCVTTIYRNKQWQQETKIKDKKLYLGKNADIMSQITAMCLAEMVATSVKNYHSNSFTPKPTIADLMLMGNDIIRGCKHRDLVM